MILSIDGVEYDVKCEIRREATVHSTDISGELLDGTYFNDVDGTYYDYELYFSYPLYSQNKYAAIYEALTEPVDGHAFVLPYNNSTIEITARVETISDEQIETDSGIKFWRATRFGLYANAPSKTMSLSQVLTRGRAPIPDIASPSVGDTYTWNGTGWEEATEYENGDDMYF